MKTESMISKLSEDGQSNHFWEIKKYRNGDDDLVIEFSLQFPTFVFGHSRSQSAENFILRTKDFLKSSWAGGTCV